MAEQSPTIKPEPPSSITYAVRHSYPTQKPAPYPSAVPSELFKSRCRMSNSTTTTTTTPQQISGLNQQPFIAGTNSNSSTTNLYVPQHSLNRNFNQPHSCNQQNQTVSPPIDRFSYNEGYNDCLKAHQTFINAGMLYFQNQQSPSTAKKPTENPTEEAKEKAQDHENCIKSLSDSLIQNIMVFIFTEYTTNRTKLAQRFKIPSHQSWNLFSAFANNGLLSIGDGESRFKHDLDAWEDDWIDLKRAGSGNIYKEPIRMKSKTSDDAADRIHRLFTKIVTKINTQRNQFLMKEHPEEMKLQYPKKQKRNLDAMNDESDAKENEIQGPPHKKQKSDQNTENDQTEFSFDYD